MFKNPFKKAPVQTEQVSSTTPDPIVELKKQQMAMMQQQHAQSMRNAMPKQHYVGGVDAGVMGIGGNHVITTNNTGYITYGGDSLNVPIQTDFNNINNYEFLPPEKLNEYKKHLAVYNHAQFKMEELLSGKQVVKKQKRIKLKL